jgi:peptide-methionine (S)-S-oxide reductase
MQKIGFGGSCHWCTEAIFRSLKGVNAVEQGWISSDGDNTALSEAVIVNFNLSRISLQTLIAVHLHTHSCTSEHDKRSKYRSAIYTFDEIQRQQSEGILTYMQREFAEPISTKVLPFGAFQLNQENYLDYYYKDPTKPFCQNIISPKLKILMEKFSNYIEPERTTHLFSR